MKREKIDINSFVYLPEGSEINVSNIPLAPPKSAYENRMGLFQKDVVDKIVGGNYGKDRVT